MTLDQVKAKLAAITGARLVRAEQAIAAGMAIVTVPATGKRAAIFGSKSGQGCYTVTGTGCTCQGWTRRGWCAHSDAVYLMLAARAAQKAEAASAALAASAPAIRPVTSERAADGSLHIRDAETGRLLSIMMAPDDLEPAGGDEQADADDWYPNDGTGGYGVPDGNHRHLSRQAVA